MTISTDNSSETGKEAVEIFLAGLPSQIATNVAYLNGSINWSITVFIGGVGASIVQSDFPTPTHTIFFSILLIAITHFFSRTCKAYINVIRFTTIEKVILSMIKDNDYEGAYEFIRKYYMEWASPLSPKTVLVKGLFELGYAYFFIIISAFIWYCIINADYQYNLYIVVATFMAVISEVLIGLLNSPYFKKVEPVELAVRQR